MNRYTFKDGRRLRCGYTTGTCAAAAAKAAVLTLLGQRVPADEAGSFRNFTVSVSLPDGTDAELEVARAERFFSREDGRLRAVRCGVRKDAGDDADVTDGMEICARAAFSDGDGIEIRGGRGIGRVTRPGLDQPVGAAAINAVPRQMIRSAVEEACESMGYEGGISVEISAPEGEKAAEKTFNPLLGVVGGISILGTSGIVEPMSDAAIVETIRAEMRVKSQDPGGLSGLSGLGDLSSRNGPGGLSGANGRDDQSDLSNPGSRSGQSGPDGANSERGQSGPAEAGGSDCRDIQEARRGCGVFLAAVPGNYGMKFALQNLRLSEEKIIKCSNFIGETLDAACEYGLSGLLLIGNAGKLIKLASGIMNTHSSHGDARIETILSCSLEAGASLGLLREIADCVTTEAAFMRLKSEGLAQRTLDIAAARAARHVKRRVRDAVKTGVILFSSEAGLTASAGEAEEIKRKLL